MLGPWTCLGTEGILAQGEGYTFKYEGSAQPQSCQPPTASKLR